MLKCTFAVEPNPKNGLIDIGPLKLDLYRYLKTELWDHWDERHKAPDDFLNKYFCYASNSKYKPEDHHFYHFT